MIFFRKILFILSLFIITLSSPLFRPMFCAEESELKLAFITCAVNAQFFQPVKKGMNDAAKMMNVHCDFLGTQGVDIEQQIELIRKAAAEGYDGLAVNIIDPEAFDDVIQETIDRGIPVVGFNVDDNRTPNARLSSVNQRLYEAGQSLAEYLLPLIPEEAQILITKHDEGVSALEDRLNGIQDILMRKKIKAATIITGNDPLKGMEVITEFLREIPAIRIIIGTGQSDTEAAGRAIEKYYPGRGYMAAGFDLSPKTLQMIQDGVIICTVDQQPYIQGFYPVVQLTHYLRYGIKPSDVDAGAAIIDKKNVQKVMELTKKNYR